MKSELLETFEYLINKRSCDGMACVNCPLYHVIDENWRTSPRCSFRIEYSSPPTKWNLAYKQDGISPEQFIAFVKRAMIEAFNKGALDGVITKADLFLLLL